MHYIQRGFPILFSGCILAGCSFGADVSSHLESDGMQLRQLGNDEAIFVTVRVDEIDPRTIENSTFSRSYVFMEVGPNHTIYSRRVSIRWRGSEMPDIEITTLDQSQIDPERSQKIRSRLAVYGRTGDPNEGVANTPKGCAIPLGLTSPAAISFGNSYSEAHTTFIFPALCDSPSGKIVKNDIQDILRMIPPLNGLEGYTSW